jgi:membrane associated rhomboid family serine protease
MLILPLHRPLTRANFPLATALLMLANVFVFLFLQSGDYAPLAEAHEQYEKSGLARYEVPAYERYLEQQGRRAELEELRALDEGERAGHVFQATLTDVEFAERLRAGELFEARDDVGDWQPLRSRQEELRGDVFTLRHMLRSSEIDPWRMLAAAFLHGGVMHLVGNMIFLAALGLLVEGTLGPLRYTALYLLGAFGSSAASLAWRWGEAGGGLGASGAIAALMGAFCVIWGRQPVRFFYWFGVVFDYVRAPAIWLFPVWLGWELYNLFAHEELAIGFDAHAGGLLSGALLGAALVATRQVRRDFIEAEPAPALATDGRWEQAQVHLGRLQLAEADALLESLQRDHPGRLDVALARFRVAQNGANRALRAQRAREVLALPASDSAAVRQQAEVLAQAESVLADEARAQLARRWMQLGEMDAAERALALPAAEADAAAEALLAQVWFELGLRRRERHEADAATRALQTVATRFPDQPQARKAEFLLQNG